jgi:hypothetical protein
MQVVHRNGDKRENIAPTQPAPLAAIEPEFIDTELEIRASHITAAAVAAAAVTAAVATMAPMPEAAPPVSPARPEIDQVQPVTQTMPQPAPVNPHTVIAAGTWRPAMGNILMLAMAALAWWAGDQLPLPQHGLKPALVLEQLSLSSLRKPGSVPPMATPVVASPVQEAPMAEVDAPRDAIAMLQQEAELRTQQLAERRAASQARRQREDAATVLREQRRRDAEAQLADARARAERAPVAVVAPAVVAVPEVPPLAEAVRQCNALSLFAREGCLWKLCSGKWGKDGCPSYQQNNEGA